jgi:protein-S-isoprenylcysteine O-methyltransferase Ste14
VLGFALSLYAATISLWAVARLGRFLVPRAVVFSDHALVTNGPYRFVRHPVYSGNLALLLGTALGTLNLLVLTIVPLAAFGLLMEARVEEELLESKFGDVYRAYAHRTGRFIPRLA